MKILLMGLGKLKFMPYMNFYLDNLDKDKHDIHLLCWNRDLKPDTTENAEGITIHEYSCYQEDDVPKADKIKSFAGYRKYALELLKKENFDFIFVVHSLTGIVLWDYISIKYKGRYVFDYRDFTYEGFLPFKSAVAGLVRGALFTFVSSDAYRIYLPQTESARIYTIHNIDSSISSMENVDTVKVNDKIRIAFWGFIRDYKLNCKVIEQLGNDNRFELHYYGREHQICLDLKSYAEENNITNVFFHGEYNPDEKSEILKNTDLIHNIYDDTGARLAVGNKYYDGIVWGKPQVCMPGSYMGVLCKQNGVGFVCSPYTEGFADKLYNGYNEMQKSNLKENCQKTLSAVINQWEKNINRIKEI